MTDYPRDSEELNKKYPRMKMDGKVVFYDKDGNRHIITNRFATPDFVYVCRSCCAEYHKRPEKCLDCGFEKFRLWDIWR